MEMTSRIFSFPNPVNEVAARLVASGVVLLSLATIVFQEPLLTLLLAYGFLARVATGPKLSPLGLLVTRIRSANTLQPTHSANTDSSVAKNTSTPSST
jgi:hypothetical protein